MPRDAFSGFEDTTRIMSLEMLPKSFGTFEKRAPGLFYSAYGKGHIENELKNQR